MAAAPQAGAEVEIYMNAAHVFTDGAVFEVDGNKDYTATVGDRVLLRAKSTTVFTVHPRRASGVPKYACICDQKTATTAGGTFTLGAWRTRDLNTELYDPDGIVSIASNQFTLAAGTYIIEWSATAHFVDGHQTRLYNATDASVVESGSSERSGVSGIHGQSIGKAMVTLAASKALEIQHQCQTTRATDGFGTATGGAFTVANEKYTFVKIRRIA
jgi:hypothetical protein